MIGVSEEFQAGKFQGKILQELETLKIGQVQMVTALNEFREKIGERAGKNEMAIKLLEGNMNIILTIGRWILAPVFSVIGFGVIFSIYIYILRK